MNGLKKFIRNFRGMPGAALFGASPTPLPTLTETARMMFELSGNAALVTGTDGVVVYLNQVAEQFTGISSQHALGQPLIDIVLLSNPKTGESMDIPLAKVLVEARAMFLPDYTTLTSTSDRKLPVDGSLGPVFAGDGRVLGTVLLLHDVSRYRLLTDALALQANQDPLTGLVNRREFETRVTRAIRKARMHKLTHALAYLDLDKFKIVNDVCGHAAGDELLCRIAAALRSNVRDRDTLARLGGDEFGLLLENCTVEAAQQVCNNLLDAVKEIHFAWQGRTFMVGVSIGLSVLDDKTDDIGALLAASDAACYRAKENGGNRIDMHTSQVKDFFAAGVSSGIARIVSALDENRFALFAQPIIPAAADPDSGKMFEILARMISPKGEYVGPADFFPAAERYQLLPQLDRWIIRRAFESYRKIYERQRDGQPAAWCLNLSAASLASEGFAAFICEEARRCNIQPAVICFEITETTAMAKNSRTTDFIWTLKAAGFRFCIDNFNKSLGSLDSVKSLPIDFIKIDGDFVKAMLNDGVGLAMVEAVHRIGKLMGVRTIAEYVESPEAFECIKAMGVDFAQGYACGRPVPIDELDFHSGSRPPGFDFSMRVAAE